MLSSHVRDTWQTPTDQGRPLVDAATGEEVARWTSQPADPGALEHARRVGGPALRELTFHQRAGILKSLAKHLNERTGEFYEPSLWTGATPRDSAVDIDGGIGVLFVYASKGTKELPDASHYVDGAQE
ncbi:MAG TPA: phenylacetic acid degradation bifunctional protein PaaZ, partial [Jiangellaceae bacterium]|nr:phenylacetic acid degradation bifunctional protein PaaZ [Jiangellaceae bacterium]